MKKVILVLGAPNDERGNLSQIATDRLNCVFELCRYNDSCQILCSGGFGGFNPTDLPHATYSKAYLVSKGIPNHFFLPFALSAHSVDDIRKALPILEEEKPDIVMLVTSDFHMERIKILWDIIAPKRFPIIFIPAVSSLDTQQLVMLEEHERNAIKALEKNNFKIY